MLMEKKPLKQVNSRQFSDLYGVLRASSLRTYVGRGFILGDGRYRNGGDRIVVLSRGKRLGFRVGSAFLTFLRLVRSLGVDVVRLESR